EVTRANRNGISFILNGRYIRNFVLSNALLQAYHTLLPIHRYPLAVVSVTMEPELVDVNVHPSKLEVRFSKEAELVEFIRTEAGKALRGEVLIPSAAQSAKPKGAIIQER